MILKFCIGSDKMAEYRTDQKKILLELLRRHCENSYSIESLMEMMEAESAGRKIPGKSTVYRLMTKLVSEGTVKRFASSGGSGFVYQIVAGEHCESHLHLKCTGCGRIIHMQENVSEELLLRIRDSSGFSVSEEDTVIFGKCMKCK